MGSCTRVICGQSLFTTRARIFIITMSSNSNRHGEWPLDAKIYIGDLGNDATRYELEDAFNPFGTVKNVWIAKRPPGFAFILMEDSRDAEDAVKELDGTRICGRRVKVELPSCPGPSVDDLFEDLH